MRLSLVTALASLLATAPATATAPSYVDDRSSPGALVQSLYNAINRQEYARALSYFSEPPVEAVDDFARTFAGMQNMRVITGTPAVDADGDGPRFQVPLAVGVEQEDGQTRILAGCYTVLGQTAQDDPAGFLPYRIADGLIEPSDAAFEEALPTRCGDGPELPPTDLTLRRATELFEKSFDETCLRDHLLAEDLPEPQAFTIPFRHAHDDIDAPAREARLFRFFCTVGAYNEYHVHILADDAGEMLPVSFVVPELDIRYEDERTMEEVRSIDVIGYTSRPELVNSHYDPDTLTMTAHAKWRGPGDASASGKWIYRSGAFTLVRYEVDATYDGEINPVTVIDLLLGP
jgi:hypothetical protein